MSSQRLKLMPEAVFKFPFALSYIGTILPFHIHVQKAKAGT